MDRGRHTERLGLGTRRRELEAHILKNFRRKGLVQVVAALSSQRRLRMVRRAAAVRRHHHHCFPVLREVMDGHGQLVQAPPLRPLHRLLERPQRTAAMHSGLQPQEEEQQNRSVHPRCRALPACSRGVAVLASSAPFILLPLLSSKYATTSQDSHPQAKIFAKIEWKDKDTSKNPTRK